MDTLTNYRNIIRRILLELAAIPYSHGELPCIPVFDEERDSYLLVTQAWDGLRRFHGIVVHMDVIHGKIWVQRDSTNRNIVRELEEAGVPKTAIVLGFRHPRVRPLTDYAVA